MTFFLKLCITIFHIMQTGDWCPVQKSTSKMAKITGADDIKATSDKIFSN